MPKARSEAHTEAIAISTTDPAYIAGWKTRVFLAMYRPGNTSRMIVA